MTTSESWWMRWFHFCIILHVQTRKWCVKVLMKLLIFLERFKTFHLLKWSLQVSFKSLWKWWCPIWLVLPLAWDALPSIHWGTWFCFLLCHMKASWNRICRVELDRCEDHQEWKASQYYWWIIGKKGHFVHIHKAGGGSTTEKFGLI